MKFLQLGTESFSCNPGAADPHDNYGLAIDI